MASINVKADLQEAERYLNSMGDDNVWIIPNILQKIGREMNKNAKRGLPKYFKEYSALSDSLKSKVLKKSCYMYITSNLTNPKNGVRYPWVHAAGWTIKTPKRVIINKRTLKTRVVGGQETKIPGKAYLGSAFFDYVRSAKYRKDLDKFVNQEFRSWERKKAKEAQK